MSVPPKCSPSFGPCLLVFSQCGCHTDSFKHKWDHVIIQILPMAPISLKVQIQTLDLNFKRPKSPSLWLFLQDHFLYSLSLLPLLQPPQSPPAPQADCGGLLHICYSLDSTALPLAIFTVMWLRPLFKGFLLRKDFVEFAVIISSLPQLDFTS